MSERVCQYCGKELIAKRGRAETCRECSKQYQALLNKNYSLMKHEKPKHTPEELEKIKEKYAGGVPSGEIEKWIRGL